jgi:NAD-dependent deacetylase
MKKIIVLSGAGMSAESGIKTFRDDDGLWQNHRFEDLASPQGWRNNPQLVLDFYNMRRKQLFEVEPNAGHLALVKLEEKFDVQIVTQNVDDLHERAGSSKVLHLHGELKKVRSTRNPKLVYTMDHWELKLGDLCEEGAQLRPHIVWFGEAVDNIMPAVQLIGKADILLVIGTSLMVYPAAGLIDYAPPNIPIYLIDPKSTPAVEYQNLTTIRKKAVEGVPELVEHLIKNN